VKFVLASKSARDQNNATAGTERLVNVYAVPNSQGGPAQFTLRSVPGNPDFSTLDYGFVRAWAVVEGVLYLVSAGSLWKVTETGLTQILAAVTDDENTSMAGHRGNITISAGGDYYVWDGSAVTQPGSGRISEVGSVAFLDQFTLMSMVDGREVEWTEVGVPDDRNALYFRTAEARDDNIVRILDQGGYLYVLKEKTTEVWGNTGRGGAGAFARVQGPVIETGLHGYNLVTRTPAGLFMVGHDKTAKLIVGQTAQPLSTPAVDQALQEETPTHCFYYEDRGAKFCVIRFANRPAWVHDLAMGLWHERSTGSRHDAWDVVGSAYAYGRWHLIGQMGRIKRTWLYPIDGSTPMRRTVVAQELYNGGRHFTIRLLELLGQFGSADIRETAPNWMTDQYGEVMYSADGSPMLSTTPGSIVTIKKPGRVWIRLSHDSGRTWGRVRMKNIGKAEQKTATCRFRALGRHRRVAVEINMTDAYDFPLLSEGNLEIA
jgi:hypothetical protein